MRERLARLLKQDTTTDLGWTVTYTDEDNVQHPFNVFTNDQFRQIVKQMFGVRVYDDWDDESTLQQWVTDFLASFTAWKGIRHDTYANRMWALSKKFEPLENYRAHEHREGSMTHGESIELSFDDRKDTTKDDSYTERSFDNYKETEKDDSSTERTFTNFKETTKDDSFVEHTNTNYKETVKDDSFTERSYTNYTETTTTGEQTLTHKVSADDVNAFSNASQDVNGQREDTKEFEGTYKDQNGFTTNGRTLEVTGSQKDQNGFATNGRVVENTGSYKDTKGFTNGDVKEITGKIKDQHGYGTNGLVQEKLGTETTAHSGTDEDEYDLLRYGNIGVTTSQQMLASDLDLLKYDISMCAIKEFIGAYTMICGEVDYGY